MISSSVFNLCALETKPIPLDNLPAISSICFFHIFVIYINTLTVGTVHFINDNLISRATWMTLFHLGNIVNEYWYESSFPLSQTDISFIALATHLDIFLISLTIENLSAFLWNRPYHLIGTNICRTGLHVVETRHVCTDGHLQEVTVIEYFM